MDGLFTRRTFTGFGASAFAPDPAALHEIRGRRPARLRALVRHHGPRCPGVYGMVDAHGELIYVGKAKCLRSRLLCYFRPKSRDPKAGRILRQTRTLVWECAPSEFAALLRELELIRRWQPRFNVHGQPRRRRRTYACLGRRPAPYVFLSARPSRTVLACFGPIPAGEQAREAVRRVNDWFRLRDCPHAQTMHFAEQQELFPVLRAAGCLRHEIGTCLGPCAGACTFTAYAEQVRAARAFLAGADSTPLEVLERDMEAASAALAFERAAALRDKRDALRWLRDHLERIRLARERLSFVYPVVGTDGTELWYVVHRGQVVQALRPPADGGGRRTLAAALRQVYRPGPAGDFATADEIDGVLLVAGWFRRHPQEQERVLEPGRLATSFGRARG